MDDKQAAALRAPFPKTLIGKLPKPTKADNPKGRCDECGGWHGLPAVHLDYVGHAAVTSRLLEVDPTHAWEPMAVDEHGLPLLDRSGNLWIRLTVGGVTRIGVGDGKNAKECISDAIRNAAMRFGVALDLWAKEDLHATDSGAAPAEGPPKRKAAARATEEAPTVPVAQAEPSFPPNVAPETNGVRFASEAQRKRLFREAKIAGVETPRLREILAEVTGQESTAQIPANLYDAVVTIVQAEPTVPA